MPSNVYPVGRLDYDSEGLLVLTNDKALTNQLLNPERSHQKTYWVQVDGAITEEAIYHLSTGVVININGKYYKTKPAIIKQIDEPDLPPRNPTSEIVSAFATGTVGFLNTSICSADCGALVLFPLSLYAARKI